MDADIFDQLRQSLEAGRLVASATILAGPQAGARMLAWPHGRTAGSLGRPELEHEIADRMQALLSDQQTARERFEQGGVVYDVFIEIFPPPARLIIVGAAHVAIPLVSFARLLGFRTTVIDPRPAFATADRFGHADQLLQGWPDDLLPGLHLDEGCYVAVLSHDDKIDLPALALAVRSPARYIGALGSRKTMARRAERLREMGVSDEALRRVHHPIGLDLGGRRPEETALAIMAEIVAVQNGRG
jgi:xanthine dehydrogenase accessory factor